MVFAMLRTVWTKWVPVLENQVLDQGFNLLFVIEYQKVHGGHWDFSILLAENTKFIERV